MDENWYFGKHIFLEFRALKESSFAIPHGNIRDSPWRTRIIDILKVMCNGIIKEQSAICLRH